MNTILLKPIILLELLKVFISHPIKDEKLALELKSVLESSDKIEIAHIAQKEKDFEIEISQKIVEQINESDYLVALITSNSKTSASVNQELGYSQGIKCPKIPLIEESAKKGCLIYGKDSVDFTRDNFSEKCNEVLDHILLYQKNNTKTHFSDEQTVKDFVTPFKSYISKVIPPPIRAYRRIMIVPTNRIIPKPFTNDIINFVKHGPEMFNIERGTLRQNEIHLIGHKPDRDYNRYGIINEKGQIALLEPLFYDKVVEVERELIYLLLAFNFAKELYKKIEYNGNLSITYTHQGVQNFQFGHSSDYHDFIMDSHTVQQSQVEIFRDVDVDFNIVEVSNSIMNEFSRACDWTPYEDFFEPYLRMMQQSYFPKKSLL